jgi:O-antigen/teichoic acid export membrane protein
MAGALVKPRGHLRVALSAWLARTVTAGAQLLAVRLLLRQLGTDSYSAWAVLVSLTAWFLLSDLGLGQALQNLVARRLASGDGAQREVRAAVGALVGCGVVLALLLILGSPWIGNALLASSVGDPSSRRSCVVLSGVLLIAGSWSTFAAKVWYAQGHGIRANVLPTLAALSALLAVAWLPARFPDSARLQVALAAWLLPTAVVGALSVGWIFASARPRTHTPPQEPIFRRALAFCSYAVLGIATLNVDYVILARAVEPSEVVGYNLASKLFGFLFFFYTATLAAYSPTVSAAHADGRLDQVYSTLKRHMTVCTAVFIVVLLGLWQALPTILTTGFRASDVAVAPTLFAAMSLLYLVRIWADGYAMFLGAIDQFSLLGRFLPLQAVVSIGLQALFAHRFGALGVVLGLLASYLLTVSWGFPLMTRSLVGRSTLAT